MTFPNNDESLSFFVHIKWLAASTQYALPEFSNREWITQLNFLDRDGMDGCEQCVFP